MNIEIQINDSTSAEARFLTWSPSPCRVRITNPADLVTPTASVTLTGISTADGGAIRFSTSATGPFTASLTVDVPRDGGTVRFYTVGQFGHPSTQNGDVTIEGRFSGAVVGSVPVMVRVRKNANNLTTGERDRFVSAFAQLNNQGAGRFSDFRDMHTAVSSAQAHGPPGFLPWHRTYILDLERELQAIDPSVALPYWRFDQPAPNIFTRDFLGVANNNGTVQFSATNPLRFWRTDGVQGINRRPFFDTTAAPPGIRTEAQTLTLGGASNLYRMFRSLEGNPHGSAHTSFGGLISSIPTAARDPLFFLLHCNVDRLWAKWQQQFDRFDFNTPASYDTSGTFPVGHNLPDTMWPWNGITGGTRPPTAPGGAMATSPCATAPGPQPEVRACLDYQGRINTIARMGFDYDDVRFA
ncbi:MAG: tyrosinase family protein [Verrucomicrobiales bacterium]